MVRHRVRGSRKFSASTALTCCTHRLKRLLSWALLIALSSHSTPALAAALTAEVMTTISACEPLQIAQSVYLDTVDASMFVSVPAGPSDLPCTWAVVQVALETVVTSSAGRELASAKARDVLGHHARRKSLTYPRAPNLIALKLLEVLWAVDPDSFVFAYVRGGKLVLVNTPAKVGAYRVPSTATQKDAAKVVAGTLDADEVLPANVQWTELLLLPRANGLLMLFADAGHTAGPFAHILKDHLGEPAEDGRSWPNVDPVRWVAARAADHCVKMSFR